MAVLPYSAPYQAQPIGACKGLRQLVTQASSAYVSAMKFALGVLLLFAPAFAMAAGPQPLGVFGDWTAASYGEGAGKACYAFTTAKSSSLALPRRGAVMLTVTQRKTASDEVTLASGYVYPDSPTVTLTVGTTVIDFYTAGQTAFTISGAKAIAAFESGATAVAKSSGPKAVTIVDHFSLAGFSGANAAIKKACP